MVTISEAPFRVLIIGGTGVFGSRLCRLLVGDSAIALTIAARDRAKVESLSRELGVGGVVLDYRCDLDGLLAEGNHDAVVHTAGPFQGQDYAVAKLCIRHRVHYLDLADDRAFVCGIDRLDEVARASSVLVCTGASTAPALTGAVVEAAVQGGMRVERVAFGIVPGNDAPRGRALVDAILSGAGKPIADQPGRYVWGRPRRLHVPGLGGRWVSACDLPEPALFASRFGVRDTYAGAGLELSILHLGLWLLAGMVRAGLVRSLAAAAGPLAWMADRLRRFGTDRGGLRVDIEGDGQRRTWCLLAEGGDGPYVPAIPAAVLIRKLAHRQLDTHGAMPCLGLLALSDLAAEWTRARLRIAAGWGEDGADLHPSLYRRAMGAAFDRMPAAGRRLHEVGTSTWRGQCAVDGAETPIGRLLSWIFQFPPSAVGHPIRVEFTSRDGRETWIRHIAGRSMRSQQYIGVRRPAGWIVERFGPLAFDLGFCIVDGRLELVMHGGRLLGIPVPRALLPRIAASESGEGGVFRFDVEIGLPLIGRLVRYRGSLELTDR